MRKFLPRVFKQTNKFDIDKHEEYKEQRAYGGSSKVECNKYNPSKTWFDGRYTIGGEIYKAGYTHEEDSLYVESATSPLMLDEHQATKVFVIAQENVEFDRATGNKKSIFTLQKYRPEVYFKIEEDRGFKTKHTEVLHDPVKYVLDMQGVSEEDVKEEAEKPRRGRPKKTEE